MTPRLVDREKRKREIALAALELFAEKSFESVSVSEIARAAGIGKGTVYEYFDSKEELILHTIVVWIEEMEVRAERVLDGTQNPEERLRRYIHLVMEAFISDERMVKISLNIFHAVFTREKLYSRYNLAGEIFRGMRKTITGMLLDGISRGQFRPEVARDAETIAVNLLAYLDGIGLHYLMSKDYFDLTHQIDFYLDNLFRSLKPAKPD
jgi:AcrR family transcriptional regulator